MSGSKDWIVCRDCCPDEPRILKALTLEQLKHELLLFNADFGDCGWLVYELPEPTRYTVTTKIEVVVG